MKIRASLTIIALLLADTAFAQSDKTPDSVDKIPAPLVRQLLQADNYEDFISQTLQIIRRNAKDRIHLTQKDIDDKEASAIRVARVRRVTTLLAMDADNDGKVTRKEVEAYFHNEANTFGNTDPAWIETQITNTMKADLNGDGVIDYKEMRTLPEEEEGKIKAGFRTQEDFIALSPRKDDTLSIDDLKKLATDAFMLVDTNKDGLLSPEEKAVLQKHAQNMTPNAAVASRDSSSCFADISNNKYNYTVYTSYVPPIERRNVSAYINKDVPPAQQYELHIIGSRMGGRKIKLMPSRKPLVIVLATGGERIWDFELQPGARVKEVILHGGSPQHLNGLPPSVTVTTLTDACLPGYAYSTQWEPLSQEDGNISQLHRTFIKNIQKYTGLVETSFQGGWRLEGELTIPFDPSIGRTAGIPGKDVTYMDPSVKATQQESLKKYMEFSKSLPEEAKPTFKLLTDMMEKGKFPIQLPYERNGRNEHAPRYFEELDYTNATVIRAEKNDDKINCNERGTPPGGRYVIIGNDKVNTIYCNLDNEIIRGGDKGNTIENQWGNTIINAGKGDDIIEAGWGRSILIFEKSWGHDLVDKVCFNSAVDGKTMYGYERNKSWNFPYENFIVFGPGVYQSDMQWEGQNALKNMKTGDQITFRNKCFNIVYYEDK